LRVFSLKNLNQNLKSFFEIMAPAKFHGHCQPVRAVVKLGSALALMSLWSCESKLNVTVSRGASKCKSAETSQAGTCVENTVGVKLGSDADGKTVTGSFKVSAVFAETVSGFEMADVTVTNGKVSVLSSTDQINYTLTVVPTKSGAVTVTVPKDAASSAAGLKSASSNVISTTYAAPATSSSSSSPSAAASTTLTLEAISDFILPYNASNYTLDLMMSGVNGTLTCDDSALSVSSSNSSVISASGITWTGTVPRCQAVISSVSNATGTSTLTFTARDSRGNAATQSAVATVQSSLVFGSNSLEFISGLRNELWQPYSATIAGGRLFIADTYNFRIQFWNSMPSTQYTPADGTLSGSHPGVVGQYSVTATDQYSYLVLSKLSTDGTRLFAVDMQGSRVLIWNTIPSSAGTPPDLVLGQSSFSTVSGGAASNSSLFWPLGVASNGTKLAVADTMHHRVLIWNTMPTTNGQAADVVVGQTTMSGATPAVSASGLLSPTSVAMYQNKLIVSDGGNRVLIWNNIPTANGASANIVLGQTNFTNSAANAGGSAAANTFSSVNDVFAYSGKLSVTDTGNNRVLIFNTIPTSNFAAAEIVLGQSTFTTTSANRGQATPSGDSLNSPYASAFDGNNFVVSDLTNNRVLIWNGTPTSNGQAADVTVGAPSFTTTGDGVFTSSTRQSPNKSSRCGSRMYVADKRRNRVLVWNNYADQSNLAPDIVLGQTSFTSATQNAGGVSASSLYGPQGVFCDGTRLLVADSYNNRVLMWTTLPTSSGQAADIVIGQANMTSSGSAATSTGLSAPTGVWSTGSVLYIADTSNNRVLKYNTIPASNGAAASLAVGQTNLTNSSSGCTAAGLSQPSNVMVTGTKLIISDQGNARVNIWNSIPGSSGLPADVIVGQPNATTCVVGSASSSTMNNPEGIASDGTKLYVADRNNFRILIYNTIPTATGTAASSVYGQSDFTTTLINGFATGSPRGKLSATKLLSPNGLDYSGGYLFISDSANQRLLAIPAP
jgi:hypothetical protein